MVNAYFLLLAVGLETVTNVIAAFVISFLGFLFLFSLYLVFFPSYQMRRARSPEKPFFMERRIFGDKGPQNRPRRYAYFARIRRDSGIVAWIYRIIAMIFTFITGLILATFTFGFLWPGSWCALLLGDLVFEKGQYIFLPLFVIICVLGVLFAVTALKIRLLQDFAPVRLVNKTDKTLLVSLMGKPIGEVAAGEKLDNKRILATHESYLIEAQDDAGNLAYSAELSMQELYKQDWVITVS